MYMFCLHKPLLDYSKSMGMIIEPQMLGVLRVILKELNGMPLMLACLGFCVRLKGHCPIPK